MFCDECVYVGDLLKKDPEDDNVVVVTQDTERFIFTVNFNREKIRGDIYDFLVITTGSAG
jgi:hypothetical protein